MIEDLAFFPSDFLCFSNANKINKHVNTKVFVIATIFWEKWWLIRIVQMLLNLSNKLWKLGIFEARILKLTLIWCEFRVRVHLSQHVHLLPFCKHSTTH